MGSECWHCHKPIYDDDEVARDRWGVNLEIHVDCLQELREAAYPSPTTETQEDRDER